MIFQSQKGLIWDEGEKPWQPSPCYWSPSLECRVAATLQLAHEHDITHKQCMHAPKFQEQEPHVMSAWQARRDGQMGRRDASLYTRRWPLRNPIQMLFRASS